MAFRESRRRMGGSDGCPGLYSDGDGDIDDDKTSGAGAASCLRTLIALKSVPKPRSLLICSTYKSR